MPGYEFYRVWGSNSIPTLTATGDDVHVGSVFPPVAGSRFWLISFPSLHTVAEGEQPEAGQDALQELAEKLPGLGEAMDPANPGMHTTSTVDYAVVLEGQIGLELGDGTLVELNRGDVLVQNGTPHAWRPISGEPSLVAFAMVGADKDIQ
jgi:hypothetical protein